MSWIYGPIAIWALRRHYAREVRPHAEAQGHCRAAVLLAAHRALDKVFSTAWPADQTPTTKEG
jgi:hypothetical protein